MEYELLDSGDGEKLERFGDKILNRPSSLCIWRKSHPHLWKDASASFVPKDGWKFKERSFETWTINIHGVKLKLRLQTNGQIGLFPEHAQYLEKLESLINHYRNSSQEIEILNLFAYTGLLSVFAAKLNTKICHVDLSEKALTWAKENLEINSAPKDSVRLICDDALKFVSKEIRRNKKYRIIIADPPSFSRTSKNQSWKLEEIISGFIRELSSLLHPEGGAIILTCHAPEIGASGLSNLLRDVLPEPFITVSDLKIIEPKSKKILPSGFFALGAFGEEIVRLTFPST